MMHPFLVLHEVPTAWKALRRSLAGGLGTEEFDDPGGLVIGIVGGVLRLVPVYLPHMSSKTARVAKRNGGAIETRAFVWPKMTIAVFSIELYLRRQVLMAERREPEMGWAVLVLGRTPEELLLRLAAFDITSHRGL